MTSRFNQTNAMKFIYHSFAAVENHRDLDSIIDIVDIDFIINGLNITSEVSKIAERILGKLKNDDIRRIY